MIICDHRSFSFVTRFHFPFSTSLSAAFNKPLFLPERNAWIHTSKRSNHLSDSHFFIFYFLVYIFTLTFLKSLFLYNFVSDCSQVSIDLYIIHNIWLHFLLYRISCTLREKKLYSLSYIEVQRSQEI